ncbi:MAG: hydrogenase maturation protease [Bacteroidota bacterium]|nr:hydrogenase maturation protease [Bacteroidota bacterium]MDX5448046.1 hydrogenase maturation protease [Bacteroidota bacterium]MDX5504705.1 hydrogenase maturation protease [Bacteroidota bacterium]
MKKRPLILGVGNLLMGDEGIGCQAIRYLESLGWDQHFELMDGGTGGFHLLDHLTQREVVVLIDATLDDLPEGTVRLIRPNTLSDFPHTLSTHEIGLKDLISSLILLEEMSDMYLVAISVKDYARLSMDLSPEVEASLKKVESAIRRVVTLAKIHPTAAL